MRHELDLVLVGGGLQNALVALAALDRAPLARVAMVEAGPAPGGNHTWSFHAGDVSPRMARTLAPLVSHRWPAYDVRFPGSERRVARAYATIPSSALAEVIARRFAAAPGGVLLLGTAATDVAPNEVRLASGDRLRAPLVVDSRGPAEAAPAVGYQKFVGLELALGSPWPDPVPVVMDARVAQDDGFRFVYVLPLAPDRVLVEDTSFSDGPDLDEADRVERLRAYVAARGCAVVATLRGERGVLPLPGSAPAIAASAGLVVGGYRGGWFHPVTGYSLPAAARLAEVIAAAFPAPPARAALDALAAEHRVQARFFALLNRLLFRATPAALRWRVLERFHRLPADTIERFYAMRTTAADRARILLGRPPHGISLRAALRELSARGAA